MSDDRTVVPAGGSRIERRIEHRTAARVAVAVALVALALGTFSGSSPTWPDRTVYACAALLVAFLWVATAIDPPPRPLTSEIADAALLALGLIRGAGYSLDLIRTQQSSYLAAIAAWAIVCIVAARPLRPRHDTRT